jgi:general secretion pathway protein G
MNRKGFTLIELLIVIAVIAILISIALPRFKGMQDEGNIAKAKGELRTLQTGIESFYIKNKAYPTSAQGLAILTTQVPQLIETVPDDPFRAPTNKYKYAVSPNGKLYTVMSVGPGGDPADTVTIDDDGVVTEGTAASNIFVSNATTDTAP